MSPAEDTEAQAGSGENGLLSTWTMSSVLGTPRHPLEMSKLESELAENSDGYLPQIRQSFLA